MTERLKKLKNEIEKTGKKLITIHDLNAEELLSKTNDGTVFLEYLLSKGGSIDNDLFEKIKNNVDVACVFCKYNKLLSGFEFNEDSLFSNTKSGQTFIEFLIKNDLSTSSYNFYFSVSKMINKIKEHVEIVDIIISSDKLFYLSELSPEIIKKISNKHFDGKYLIEKYLKNNEIAEKIIPLINDSKLLLNFCLKNDDFNFMKYANYNILMEKNDENEYVLQYLLDKKKIIPNALFLDSIFIINEEDKRFIKFLSDNKFYSFLGNTVNEDILSMEVEKGQSVLDILLKNGCFLKKQSFSDEKNIISLYKNGRLDLIKPINSSLLLKPVNDVFKDNTIGNETLFEYLQNNNCLQINDLSFNESFVRFLIENKLYSVLANLDDEEFLTLETEEGKTVLDILLKEGYVLKCKNFSLEKNIITLYKNNRLDLIKTLNSKLLLKPVNEIFEDELFLNISLLEYLLENGYQPINIDDNLPALGLDLNKEIAEILYKKQKSDVLAKIESAILLNKTSDGNTYFDYVLKCIKERKIKSKIPVKPYEDVYKVAEYYLTIARNDMMGYVKKLKKENLLRKYNEKTLLDALLELDKDLTLDKVITNNVKANIDVAAILKSKGIVQEKINLPLKEKYFNEYLDNFEINLGVGPIYTEGDLLLKRIEELFLTDGKSDERLVQALISGYRHALIENYDDNINELKNLINIKENNKEKFYYIMDEKSGAFFSNLNGYISCNKPVVSTLLHETGHALHYYMADNKIPKLYEEIKQKVRENPETLIKIKEYAKQIKVIKNEVTKLVNQKYDSFFKSYYNNNLKEEIRAFLLKPKVEKKEEFKKMGISDDIIEIILDKTFTEEEYIAQQKKIFIKQNVDVILSSIFCSYRAICDILDAIYDGEIFSQVLKDNEGNVITGFAGHGLSYYYGTIHGFDEMVAQFSVINKSKNSDKMLKLLRSIVGDELYNMLSEFYYQYIIHGKTNQMEEFDLLEIDNIKKY